MVKYAQHIERGTDLAWLIYRVSCSAFIFGIGLRVWSIATNGWYMLSGRISESVPVRQDMTVKKGAETTHTTEPRPAICTVLAVVIFIRSVLFSPIQHDKSRLINICLLSIPFLVKEREHQFLLSSQYSTQHVALQ